MNKGAHDRGWGMQLQTDGVDWQPEANICAAPNAGALVCAYIRAWPEFRLRQPPTGFCRNARPYLLKHYFELCLIIKVISVTSYG